MKRTRQNIETSDYILNFKDLTCYIKETKQTINANIEIDAAAESIWDMTKYNNSNTTHRLITLVEADGRNDIGKNGYSENSDLFTKGKVCSDLKWYDNTNAEFTIKVNDITTSKAIITIT